MFFLPQNNVTNQKKHKQKFEEEKTPIKTSSARLIWAKMQNSPSYKI